VGNGIAFFIDTVVIKTLSPAHERETYKVFNLNAGKGWYFGFLE
jgi:hypothetical protein